MIYTAIDTFYLTNEELKDSPSRRDGIDENTENSLRFFGAELIQQAGILLKLPQAVMVTGQVLFHRFYCKKSFKRFNVKRVAASCVYLAGKLEEHPSRIKDMINVFHRIDQRRENLPLTPLEHLSKQYEEMKTDLIRTERHLLKEMGFICHVEHPHKFIISYLNQLEVDDEQVKQEAWNIANDSLRTTLCVRYKNEVIACGIVFFVTRKFQIPLPENPPWWVVFDATKRQILSVCRSLIWLYSQPKSQYTSVNADEKSFVLSTRAWEPPPPLQSLPSILKSSGNVEVTQAIPSAANVPTTIREEPQTTVAADGDKKEAVDLNAERKGKSVVTGVIEELASKGMEIDQALEGEGEGEVKRDKKEIKVDEREKGQDKPGDEKRKEKEYVDDKKIEERRKRRRSIDKEREERGSERDREKEKAKEREREKEKERDREKEKERRAERVGKYLNMEEYGDGKMDKGKRKSEYGRETDSVYRARERERERDVSRAFDKNRDPDRDERGRHPNVFRDREKRSQKDKERYRSYGYER